MLNLGIWRLGRPSAFATLPANIWLGKAVAQLLSIKVSLQRLHTFQHMPGRKGRRGPE